VPLDASLDDLSQRFEIVTGFCNKRRDTPQASKTVGPAAGDKTLYRLAYGHDHRGATWFDESNAVVWLCALALHRSGQKDDAFPYFHGLIQTNCIYPSPKDYESLEDDRARRFAELAGFDARALLARAEATHDQEVRGIIGGEVEVGVAVWVVQTHAELFVVFSAETVTDVNRIVLILAAFAPGRRFDDWRPETAVPSRDLREGEVCFCIERH
jgi:hypothetical protein